MPADYDKLLGDSRASKKRRNSLMMTKNGRIQKAMEKIMIQTAFVAWNLSSHLKKLYRTNKPSMKGRLPGRYLYF